MGSGVIDYVLNLNLSDRGLLVIPVGLAFFILYYATFYFIITKRNVPVVGREQGAASLQENGGGRLKNIQNIKQSPQTFFSISEEKKM